MTKQLKEELQMISQNNGYSSGIWRTQQYSLRCEKFGLSFPVFHLLCQIINKVKEFALAAFFLCHLSQSVFVVGLCDNKSVWGCANLSERFCAGSVRACVSVSVSVCEFQWTFTRLNTGEFPINQCIHMNKFCFEDPLATGENKFPIDGPKSKAVAGE